MRPRCQALEKVSAYFCSPCKIYFARPDLLSHHLVLSHPHTICAKNEDNTLSCKVCNEVFTDEITYATHCLRHKKKRKDYAVTSKCEKSHVCGICSKTFRTVEALNTHFRKHSQYKCGICYQLFGSCSALWYHAWVHTGLKPHICNICGKGYARLYRLRYHYSTHSDARPYKCCTCKKSFKLRGTLKNHEKIHKKRGNKKKFTTTSLKRSTKMKHSYTSCKDLALKKIFKKQTTLQIYKKKERKAYPRSSLRIAESYEDMDNFQCKYKPVPEKLVSDRVSQRPMRHHSKIARERISIIFEADNDTFYANATQEGDEDGMALVTEMQCKEYKKEMLKIKRKYLHNKTEKKVNKRHFNCNESLRIAESYEDMDNFQCKYKPVPEKLVSDRVSQRPMRHHSKIARERISIIFEADNDTFYANATQEGDEDGMALVTEMQSKEYKKEMLKIKRKYLHNKTEKKVNKRHFNCNEMKTYINEGIVSVAQTIPIEVKARNATRKTRKNCLQSCRIPGLTPPVKNEAVINSLNVSDNTGIMQMKEFDFPVKRSQNIRFHRNIYNCSTCGRVYKHNWTLRRHRRRTGHDTIAASKECSAVKKSKRATIHSGRNEAKYSYSAKQCQGLVLKIKWKSKTQTSKDSRERPYTCEYCVKKYLHKQSLWKHLWNCHGINIGRNVDKRKGPKIESWKSKNALYHNDHESIVENTVVLKRKMSCKGSVKDAQNACSIPNTKNTKHTSVGRKLSSFGVAVNSKLPKTSGAEYTCRDGITLTCNTAIKNKCEEMLSKPSVADKSPIDISGIPKIKYISRGSDVDNSLEVQILNIEANNGSWNSDNCSLSCSSTVKSGLEERECDYFSEDELGPLLIEEENDDTPQESLAVECEMKDIVQEFEDFYGNTLEMAGNTDDMHEISKLSNDNDVQICTHQSSDELSGKKDELLEVSNRAENPVCVLEILNARSETANQSKGIYTVNNAEYSEMKGAAQALRFAHATSEQGESLDFIEMDGCYELCNLDDRSSYYRKETGEPHLRYMNIRNQNPFPETITSGYKPNTLIAKEIECRTASNGHLKESPDQLQEYWKNKQLMQPASVHFLPYVINGRDTSCTTGMPPLKDQVTVDHESIVENTVVLKRKMSCKGSVKDAQNACSIPNTKNTKHTSVGRKLSSFGVAVNSKLPKTSGAEYTCRDGITLTCNTAIKNKCEEMLSKPSVADKSPIDISGIPKIKYISRGSDVDNSLEVQILNIEANNGSWNSDNCSLSCSSTVKSGLEERECDYFSEDELGPLLIEEENDDTPQESLAVECEMKDIVQEFEDFYGNTLEMAGNTDDMHEISKLSNDNDVQICTHQSSDELSGKKDELLEVSNRAENPVCVLEILNARSETANQSKGIYTVNNAEYSEMKGAAQALRFAHATSEQGESLDFIEMDGCYELCNLDDRSSYYRKETGEPHLRYMNIRNQNPFPETITSGYKPNTLIAKEIECRTASNGHLKESPDQLQEYWKNKQLMQPASVHFLPYVINGRDTSCTTGMPPLKDQVTVDHESIVENTVVLKRKMSCKGSVKDAQNACSIPNTKNTKHTSVGRKLSSFGVAVNSKLPKTSGAEYTCRDGITLTCNTAIKNKCEEMLSKPSVADKSPIDISGIPKIKYISRGSDVDNSLEVQILNIEANNGSWNSDNCSLSCSSTVKSGLEERECDYFSEDELGPLLIEEENDDTPQESLAVECEMKDIVQEFEDFYGNTLEMAGNTDDMHEISKLSNDNDVQICTHQSSDELSGKKDELLEVSNRAENPVCVLEILNARSETANQSKGIYTVNNAEYSEMKGAAQALRFAHATSEQGESLDFIEMDGCYELCNLDDRSSYYRKETGEPHLRYMNIRNQNPFPETITSGYKPNTLIAKEIECRTASNGHLKESPDQLQEYWKNKQLMQPASVHFLPYVINGRDTSCTTGMPPLKDQVTVDHQEELPNEQMTSPQGETVKSEEIDSVPLSVQVEFEKYLCFFCQSTFQSRYSLKRHLINRVCKEGTFFYRKRSMKKNMNGYRKESDKTESLKGFQHSLNNQSCFSTQSFTVKDGHTVKGKRTLLGDNFKCNICSVTCMNISSLRRHLKLHNPKSSISNIQSLSANSSKSQNCSTEKVEVFGGPTDTNGLEEAVWTTGRPSTLLRSENNETVCTERNFALNYLKNGDYYLGHEFSCFKKSSSTEKVSKQHFLPEYTTKENEFICQDCRTILCSDTALRFHRSTLVCNGCARPFSCNHMYSVHKEFNLCYVFRLGENDTHYNMSCNENSHGDNMSYSCYSEVNDNSSVALEYENNPSNVNEFSIVHIGADMTTEQQYFERFHPGQETLQTNGNLPSYNICMESATQFSGCYDPDSLSTTRSSDVTFHNRNIEGFAGCEQVMVIDDNEGTTSKASCSSSASDGVELVRNDNYRSISM